MAHIMKGCGKQGKLMAMENYTTQMAIFTRVNGCKTKPMARVPIRTLMEPSTLVNGVKTSSMAWGLKIGLTVQFMKANILREKSIIRES